MSNPRLWEQTFRRTPREREVVLVFGDGATLAEPLEDYDARGVPLGEWTPPLPNEEGNSFAYGYVENFAQGSDIIYVLAERHGELAKVIVRERA